MPYLSTSRLTFYYRSQGKEDGLPLLLLHGSFATGRWWEPLLALLPEEIRAVAPDLRGCGQTEKPATGYTIEELAEDVYSFAQALGWTHFDLVAHASSGAVAVELALNHPSLLRTLVLVDTVPVEGVATPLDMLMALSQMQHDRTLLRKALSILMPTFDPLESAANAAFFKLLVDDAAQMAPAAFTAIAESLGRWNRFADARQLTLPALLIWGDLDEVVHRDAMTRTLIAIPGANNLEILHGVGHSPMIEAPLTLAEKIIDFLAEDFEALNEVRASAYASTSSGAQDKPP